MGLDRQDVIRLLNQDIYGEHDAIVHYLTQAWTVAHQYGPQIEQIARDEMRHLKWLSHSVVALGGIPDLATPMIRSTGTAEEAMEQDMRAEVQAIEQYQDHIAIIPDPRVQRLLSRIVVDEKDHYRQFTELLDQQQGEPWGLDHPEQSVTGVAHQLKALVGTEYQAVLGYLMESFIKQHQRQVGMDYEDRAVDEMKHLGWLAEQLAALGIAPSFEIWRYEDRGRTLGVDDVREVDRYMAIRHWADERHPELLPLLDRILAQEEYQRSLAHRTDGWTVGPLRDTYLNSGGV